MTDLTTSDAALRLCLASGERREIIMENELLVALDEHLVHFLHIELGTEGYRGQGLGFSTGEDC